MLDLVAVMLDWIVRIVNISVFTAAVIAYFYRRIRRRTVQKFLGGTSVTTCFPARHLSGRTVVDEADLVATQMLERFLGKYGIDVQHELILPDGSLDLDRKGLIVICGPKTSQTIARLIERDDVVRFEQGEKHWYLADQLNQRHYYSLRDVEEIKSDIGYLSRTQRSDALSQKFLSIAGIHSQGSTIVVRHLCNYRVIKRYLKQFKKQAFSAVISGIYDDSPMSVHGTHEILARKRRDATRMFMQPRPRPATHSLKP